MICIYICYIYVGIHTFATVEAESGCHRWNETCMRAVVTAVVSEIIERL